MKFGQLILMNIQWRQEGAKGVMRPRRHCAGGGIWRGENVEFWN